MYSATPKGCPRGPERDRAAVAARAVAFILLPGETPDLNLLYAPTYVDVDHRTVGYGALSREHASKLAESFQTVADDVRFRIDDVLALDPNGLVRKTASLASGAKAVVRSSARSARSPSSAPNE